VTPIAKLIIGIVAFLLVLGVVLAVFNTPA
jgi:hypothetical protein